MSDLASGVAETMVAEGPATSADDHHGQDGASFAHGAILAKRWELLGLLGVGGMGSVYRARDVELDEIVAVKVLRRELARSAAMVERFRREVKLARRVTHPNVARTFDIGEDGELRFLTMELLDGRPLSSLLARERRLPLGRIAAIGRSICAGLAAAHAADVVHRDLKPDNVLLTRDGRVVITDFGIARALEIEGSAGDTQGAVVGTPLYMAPEQIAHDAPIGPATDLYALGCMLFEMATGAPPWSGPTPLAIAAARLIAPAPSLAITVPELPTAFVALVERLLARAASARPSSAGEVGDILERIAAATSSPGVSLLPPAGAPSIRAGASPSGLAPSFGGGPSLGGGQSLGGGSTPWASIKTVAVLPIDNRGDGADAYLAAGLTDDLVDLLSASPRLRVRPRAVAERAQAESGTAWPGPRDPRDIGRDLEVQVVVSGELRRQGDTLQVNVRVVTVEDGFQLWAGRFRAPAAEFLRIGDEAAAAIAEVLVARLAAPRAAPTDPRALDLYLRGRFLLRRNWAATPEATPLLREAAELAPQDLAIRLTYARALVRAVSVGELPQESANTAWEIVDSALRESPRLAEALLARASLHLLRGATLEAVKDLRVAIVGAPDLQEALASLGDIMADAGMTERARATLGRAIELDPMHLSPRLALARLEVLFGDPSRGRILLGEPPGAGGDREVYWISRARLALWNGDRAEAELVQRECVEALAPAAGDPSATLIVSPELAFLRRVATLIAGATLGHAPSVDAAVRQQIGVTGSAGPRVRAFRHQFRAEVLATLGERELAVESVAAAEANGAFDVMWVERCPALDPLRAIPAFADAMERIRARAALVREALTE